MVVSSVVRVALSSRISYRNHSLIFMELFYHDLARSHASTLLSSLKAFRLTYASSLFIGSVKSRVPLYSFKGAVAVVTTF
jgi:hypothetical protein